MKKQTTNNKPKKSKSKGFFLKLRSRHPSTSRLRMGLKLPVKAVYRHGSTTATEDKYEINSVRSVNNSSAKFSMKACFTAGNVRTAAWFFLAPDKKSLMRVNRIDENGQRVMVTVLFKDLEFPIVAKLNMGSRARGMVKIDSIAQLETFVKTQFNNQYYFETFHNYVREYRLHVSAQGCFYTCRKMIKADTPEDKRWYRNDSNCSWIMEENQLFDKPTNWNKIVEECVKALTSVGLDVGACDVRVQSSDKDGKKRTDPDFIVIEINSAPAFGDITLERYKENLPKILCHKYGIPLKS